MSSPVSRIVIEGGAVKGVQIGDERYDAPVVISNADGTKTLTDLVGLENLKRPLVKRLERLKPSISSFLLYAGTSYEFASHENLLFDHWSHDETYADILAARPGGMSVVVPHVA